MANSVTTTILSASDKVLSVSGDGHLIAYVDTSGGLNVYDLANGQSYLIDTLPEITSAVFSADAHSLFYSAGSSEAGPGSSSRLYVRDLATPTQPVDVTPTLLPPSSPTLPVQSALVALAVSDDGNTIVYKEEYRDFGADPSTVFYGIVVENRTTGIVEQFNSKAFATYEYDNDVRLSGDGRYLSFSDGGTFHVRDLQSHTWLQSLPISGTAVGQVTGEISALVSSDQRFVVHEAGVGTTQQILLHDNNAPATPDQVISTSADGVAGNHFSFLLAFSGNGKFAVFQSSSTNLTPEGQGGIFVKDVVTGAIKLVAPEPSVSSSYTAFISDDGSEVITQGSNGIAITKIGSSALTVNPVTADNYVNAAEGPLVTVSGTSDAIGKTVIVSLPGATLFQFSAATVRSDGTWSTTINVGKLGDGLSSVHAVVTDDFGKTTTVDHSFTIDRTPPEVTIVSVAGDDIINAAELAHASVKGTVLVADPSGPGTMTGTLKISIDGGQSTTFQSPADALTTAYSFSQDLNASGVPDGEHTITLTATDPAGNTTTVTRQVLVDATPPKIAITSVSGDDVVDSTEVKSPQGVHGTSDAIGQTVHVLVDGTEAGQAVVQNDGTWLTTVSFGSVATGQHDVTATVSDGAGNPGRADAGVYVDRGFSVERLSVGPNGEQGGGQGVLFPGLAADGTKLVFTGLNFNLMSTATGSDGAQVYVKDLTTGAISFATPNPSDNAEFGAISPDGHYLEFVSDANLDPNNQSYASGLYFTLTKDLTTGTVYGHGIGDDEYDGTDPDTFHPGITDAYYDLGGYPHGTPIQPLPVFPLAIANGGESLELVDDFEPDQVGRPVEMSTFVKAVDDYVDTNGTTSFYTGSNVLPDTFPPSGNIYGDLVVQESAPQLSADGSVAAIEVRFFPEHWDTSSYPPRVTLGASTVTQIYVGGATFTGDNPDFVSLASSYADGTPMPFGAVDPALSADGKFVAFWSWGTDGAPEVFVKNLTTGELDIASSDAGGTAGIGNASGTFNAGFNTIAISADGRYVAFTSDAKLTPDDTDNTADLFVKDMQTGAIERIALPAGTFANDLSTQLTMRADGQYIAFVTSAALSSDDTNGTSDVYGISLASLGTAPKIAIAAVTGDHRIDAAEASNHVTVSGTSDAIGQTVSLSVDGNALPGVVVAANGTWSTTLDFTGLVDGVHQLRASVSTAAGSTGSDGDLVTVDRVAPTVVLSTDKTHLAAGETATITASFSEGIGNVTSNFFAATGGTLDQLKFINDHTLTAIFTPDAGATTFTIGGNPGTAFDYAGNSNAAGTMTVGLAVDGYLSGSIVFHDANGNGVYDPGEVATTTDSSGGFVLNGGSGPLVLQGGFDLGTNLPFKGVLAAPDGFSSITPLTTLAAYVQQESGGDLQAMTQLVDTLAHIGQSEVLHDIVAEAAAGQVGAQIDLLSNVQVADEAALMTAALAGASGLGYAKVYTDVMHGLAHGIVVNGAGIDLSAQVPAVMSALSQTYGIDPTIAQNITGVTNAVVHDIADAAAHVPTGADGATFLTDLYGIARLADGAASDAVSSPAAQAYDPFGTIAAEFSSDNLAHAIVAATAQTADTGLSNQAPIVTGSVTLAAIAENSAAHLITQAELLSNVRDDDGPSLIATGLTIATGAGTLTDNLDGTWSYTPAAGDDTGVTFSYQVTDGVAAPVADSATLDTTADTTADVGGDLAVKASSALVNKAGEAAVAFTVTGLDSDATAVVTFTDFANQTVTVHVTANGSGTANLSTLGDGKVSLSIVATDTSHNTASGAGDALTLDTIAAAPVVALAVDSGASATDHITNSGVVNVLGLETGATWQYSVDSGAHWLAGSGTSFTLTGDGAKSVLVQQTDLAGNVSAATALSFTLDTIAPGLAFVTPSGHIIADRPIEISGTAGIEDSGRTIDITEGTAVLGTAIVGSDGRWHADVTLHGVGDHTLVASATDLAGNTDHISTTLAAVANGFPTAGSDQVTAQEHTPLVISAAALLANDTDPDGDTLNLLNVGHATHGEVVFDAAQQTVTFTPDAGYSGAAAFDYTVSDGHGGLATGKVGVTVKAGPTGGGWGDVHYTSFDGFNFNLQSTGDYVVAHATAGPEFEVEGRAENLGHTGVSYLTAVAVEAGDHLIVFDEAKPNTMLIDGHAVAFAVGDRLDLGDGVVIGRATATTHQIETSLDFVQMTDHGSYLDLSVHAGAARGVDSFEGLLGNLDGNAKNDFDLPNGTSLVNPNTHLIEGQFADAWRVGKDSLLASLGDETFAQRLAEAAHVHTAAISVHDWHLI
jgi:hypothetical protein